MKRAELIKGDCFAEMQRMPGGVVHLVLTDPPYGTTELAWDQSIVNKLALFWGEIDRLTIGQAVVVVFAAQPFVTDLINSNRRGFAYDLIWCKPTGVGFLNANKMPLKAHEHMLVFKVRRKGSGPAIYHPQMESGKPYARHRSDKETRAPHYGNHKTVDTINTGTRHPRSWQLVNNRCGTKSKHPTQKPVDLLRWLVRSYSNPSDVVFDPFAGSGSSLVAAALEDRRSIGIERDPGYFSVAAERIREAVMQ